MSVSDAMIRRLATVVRGSNDAVLLLDLDGTIRAWNRGAERIYGYAEKEGLGQNIRILVPDDELEETDVLLSRLARGEVVESFETTRVTKDGSLRDVWLTVTLLTDEGGQPESVATTERDITERKRLEAERLRLEQRFQEKQKLESLGVLAGGIAGAPAGGDEQAFRAQLARAAVHLGDRDDPAGLLANRPDGRTRQEADSFLLEERSDRGTDLGLVAVSQEPRAPLDNRHVGAETLEHLAELERDVAAARDDERARQLSQLDLLAAREQVAREVRYLGEPLDARHDRARAGGDEEGLAGQTGTGDVDVLRIQEAGVALDDADVPADEALVLLLPVAGDDLVLGGTGKAALVVLWVGGSGGG